MSACAVGTGMVHVLKFSLLALCSGGRCCRRFSLHSIRCYSHGGNIRERTIYGTVLFKSVFLITVID